MTIKKKAKQTKVKAKQQEKKKAISDSKGKSVDKKVGKKEDLSKKKSSKKSPSPPAKSQSKKDSAKKVKEPSPKKGGKRSAPQKSKDDDKIDKNIKKTKSDEKVVKVVTKGGAAVDSLVPNLDSFRVFQDGGKVYSATLNQSNLDHNNNKFYIIQILQNEKTNSIHVWNRWGRVGVPGQSALKGPFDKQTAINDYNKKHREKTSGGNYKEIQIKYDDDEGDKAPKQTKKAKSTKEIKSKMDIGMQKLISLIFDVNIMNNTMKEIGYDAKKMPLGKLGDSTIKQAYAVLSKLSKAIKNKQTNLYKTLSSDFYTLIPHDFGFKNMINFVLDNDEKVKEKIRMLQTISDMKVTTKLLQKQSDEQSSIYDQNYKKLGCSLKTVDQSSSQYKLMSQYFNNTKGSFTKVAVGQIYQVNRPSEFKQFNSKIGNNILLWHGSRISNFVGILSQGLRIAPPQAPVSGYLFGKGIYLADMAQKSIHYCRSYGSDTALILLIQGAIGHPNVLLNSNCQAKQEMQKCKKDSTKCHGSKAPPESSYVKHKDMQIPKGAPKPTNSGSYMGHNEFIVYNKNQARIRYIIRMDMKGQ